MRKVRNNQAIARLSVKSFQASRTRNRIAALAIVLTALLFTAVFTIGLGMKESTERSNMRMVGSDMHGVIKNLTKEQYERFRRHPSIREEAADVAVCYDVKNPEFVKRRVEMHFYPQRAYTHNFIEIIDGRTPEGADEILLDETSLQLLGMEARAGQQVTLDMQLHMADTETEARTFTVSGVIRAADGMNIGFAIVSEAYLDAYEEELSTDHEDPLVGWYDMSVMFDNSADIMGKLRKIIIDNGYSNDETSPDYIGCNANWAYMSDSFGGDLTNYLPIAAALLLILLTGYLIIYNIFQISVITDIRYYGLLKTIGTTGRQIKRILRRQALMLCVMGIPLGLILGYFTGLFLLPVILSAGSFVTDSDISASPRPWIYIGAAAFTVLTVLISEWRPGRIAARVSPVEALRYTEQATSKKKLKKTTDGGRITRMALSNLGRNKICTFVVICSLSLTVVLLNSIYTVSRSVDRKGMTSAMILSEATLQNARMASYEYYPTSADDAQEYSLTESFIEAVSAQESFADGGRLYGDVYNVHLPVESWKIPENITTREGVPGFWYNGQFHAYDFYDEGFYQTDFYGIEPFVLSKMTIVEGETDKDVIWEKLQTGNYLLYGAEIDDNGAVLESELKHHAGEKITLSFCEWPNEEKETKEYEILAVVKRHTYSLADSSGSNFTYYTTADEFKRHLPGEELMKYILDVKEGGEEQMEEFLADYTQNEEPTMDYVSRKMYEGMVQQLVGAVVLVGTALAAFIGLIGILNFINALLTAMVTRKREFAMMEAIGMTKRQLVGMLTTEGLLYAALTILSSLILSALFSLGAVRAVGGSVWFITYRFTLAPALLACPVLLLLGACIPRIVYALRKKESIVEEIRE